MPIYHLHEPAIRNTPCQPKVYAYYFTEWNGFEMKVFHEHPWMEIMYVVQGTCSIHFENQFSLLKSGEFVFLHAHTPHRLVVDQDTSCRMLNLEFGFEPLLQENPLMISIAKLIDTNEHIKALVEMKDSYFLLKDVDEMYPILMSLINELSIEYRKNPTMIHLQIFQLLIILSRQAIAANTSTSAYDHYVRKAIHYMNHRYDQAITVEEIAADINIHPSYLHRIFRKTTGQTLIDYLTQLRIEKAKMLLERTDIPVIDISDHIGLGSRQYFSYVFKKNTGISPIQYRKGIRS